jgi:hypothetical protein
MNELTPSNPAKVAKRFRAFNSTPFTIQEIVTSDEPAKPFEDV